MEKTVLIAPKKRSRRLGRGAGWREYGLALIMAILLALVAKYFFLQAFRIPSRSMEDSLLAGDYLLVDKFSYGPRWPGSSFRLPGRSEPAPGDVVLFEYPDDVDRVYIKRCVATAGQIVELRNKVLYVDGVRSPDPPYSKYLDARIFPASANPRDNFGPLRVPVDHLFVLGDNRDNSRDSRHWGPLAKDRVVGRAFCIYWSYEYEPDLAGSRAAARSGFAVEQLLEFPGRVRWSRLGGWVQ